MGTANKATDKKTENNKTNFALWTGLFFVTTLIIVLLGAFITVSLFLNSPDKNSRDRMTNTLQEKQLGWIIPIVGSEQSNED